MVKIGSYLFYASIRSGGKIGNLYQYRESAIIPSFPQQPKYQYMFSIICS